MAYLLEWDKDSERFYETGVSNCVLFVANSSGWYGNGVAWNGITNISENPSGAEASPLYADNTKYLELISNEDFGATIEAYTYPDEWAECDGSKNLLNDSGSPLEGVTLGQQTRKKFALAYKTLVGNDTDGTDKGYKIHLVYGCQAAPSEKAYATVNDSPEAITFSWEVTTTPIDPKITGLKPTSIITIDSTKVNDDSKMTALINKIWGVKGDPDSETADVAAAIPTIAQLVEIFSVSGGNGDPSPGPGGEEDPEGSGGAAG